MHHAVGIAHDAAAVGDHVLVIRTGQLQGVHGADRQVLQLQRRLADGDIHRGLAAAVRDQALVAAGDAAGHALSVHRAADAAAADRAVVIAHQAADAVFAADRAGKAAAGDAAPVHARKTAQLGAAGLRRDAAGNLQILHLAAGLYVAEEALVGTVGGKTEPGDAVSAAVKDAAKGGDGVDGRLAQVQISVQDHPKILRIAVKPAA